MRDEYDTFYCRNVLYKKRKFKSGIKKNKGNKIRFQNSREECYMKGN